MIGELEYHISESKLAGQPSRKNSKSKKTIRSLSSGEFEIETARDRLGTFDPKVVPKRQLIITEELEGNILSMHSTGISTRAMRDYLQEMCAMYISAAEIPGLPIVCRLRYRNGVIVRWRPFYPFLFLDCMFFKVRVNGAVESRAIYNILGVDIGVKKNVLGLYTS